VVAEKIVFCVLLFNVDAPLLFGELLAREEQDGDVTFIDNLLKSSAGMGLKNDKSNYH